jgi:hypothetical protein
MLDVMIVGLTVQALLTCLVLYVAARHEADYDFQKVLVVTAGLAVVNVVLDYALKPQIGLFYIIPCLAITVWVFHDACWLPWPRAFLCTFLLAGLNAMAALGIGFVAGKLLPKNASHVTLMEQHEADLREAKQAMEDAYRDQQDVQAVEMPGPATPPPATTNAPAAVAPPPATVTPPPATVVAPPPPITTPSAPVEEWSAARAKLRVGGRIRGRNGAPVALINGEVCAIGDPISATHNGRRYTWRVAAITDKAVDLAPVSCVASP